MPADELSSALSRDPAPSFRRWLIGQGHLDEQAAVELDGRAQQSVDDAFSFAKASAPPGPEEIQTDLFATSTGV
jgi:pyruvate dehydrogenase E1 component alpha subunit